MPARANSALSSVAHTALHCREKHDLTPKVPAVLSSSARRCIPGILGYRSSQLQWSHPGATGCTPAQLLKVFLCSYSSKCRILHQKLKLQQMWECSLLFHRKGPVLQRSPAGQTSPAVGTCRNRGQGRGRESYAPAAGS